ncbi:hypothetical protein PisoF_01450 [Pseudomonas sp. IsoF]|nr:hypothetical protein PC358_25695 [Pseudomonas capeferrum]UPL05789.1 hypothetical protein PisoF_01450 [Pseudomonas sp. IsoF]
MNGFSKGILLLNTGSGPAFIIEQAFKLNMDRDLMRTGVLIGLCLYRPFRGASPLPQVPHQTRDWGAHVGAGWPRERDGQDRR